MNYFNTIFRSMVMIAVMLVVSSCTNSKSTGYFKKDLSDNWFIQSADSVLSSGQQISSREFKVKNWYPASVPSTVLNALVKDSVYRNIFKDMNLKSVSSEAFKSSWWYRTEFNLDKVPQTLLLHFEGVNYKANVWINGKQIANVSLLKNAFRQFKFNISDDVKEGINVLVVQVFPPVAGDFYMGFVDWNPAPPDNDMGLFRKVYLEANAGVGVSEPFIVSTLRENLSEAALTASILVTNYTDVNQSGKVILKINDKSLIKPLMLKAGETKKVIFSPEDFAGLNISNPKLWWPHTMGNPHLYHAKFSFLEDGKVSDDKPLDFGIRTVSSYFTKQGFRGFKINGKKILIRGGGWTDRMLLDGTPESIRNQLEYVKDMNLNTIRLEGFWGSGQALYNLCDQMGILIMVGWSAQWEWEQELHKPVSKNYGGIISPSDVDMMSRAWQDQIIWLRNHPSIFVWLYGSDKIPKPSLEKKYLKILTEYDSTRVHLASAREWTSLAGPTGVKMRGPYAYEPPVYWFSDTLYGGAFGFNTETGPGAQVPPLESIEKMISKKHLWPIDSVWDYHSGRHMFNTLDRYTKALEARYGKATSVEDYTKKAQVLNYELMRPMFEAFSAYRYKATGVIQWMLNSAWPEMYWQLYDYYLMPNGAYYGAKKASQPYHIIYDYAHHTLFAVNDKLKDKNGCTLKIRVYNFKSQLKYEKEIKINLKANAGREIVKLPEFPWVRSVYFIDLRLMDNTGKEIDNNFYWLSHKMDVLDYKAKPSGWYFYTPSKQYADFTALNDLPKVKVSGTVKEITKQGYSVFAVELTNSSKYIAFFVHPAIVNKVTGNTILPVLWSDNYVSLLPGESRKLYARINNKYLKNKKPQLVVKGYNLEDQ